MAILIWLLCFRLKLKRSVERRGCSAGPEQSKSGSLGHKNRNKRVQDIGGDVSKKPLTIPDPEKPQGVLVSVLSSAIVVLDLSSIVFNGYHKNFVTKNPCEKSPRPSTLQYLTYRK